MREPTEFDLPGGLPVVQDWVEELFSNTAGIGLWTRLDDQLRLALTQAWILNVFGQPDDTAAAELSQEGPRHPLFSDLLGYSIRDWRQVYAMLKDDYGVLGQQEPIGVDIELVLLVDARYCGEITADTPAWGHSFITRFTNTGWKIAALARRLPVPGWPPTEQVIPGLSIDG